MNMEVTQMNTSHRHRTEASAPRRKPRSGWYTVTLTIWLLFLSVVVAAGVMQYRNSRQAWPVMNQNAEPESLVQSVLAERVEEMAARLQSESSNLRDSLQSGLEAVRHELDERVTSISEQVSGQINDVAG